MAGLATAIGLARAGWDVTVLEAASQGREVGAGFALAPNGVRALAALGLDAQALAASWPVTLAGFSGPDGRPVRGYDVSAPYAAGLRVHGMERRGLLAILAEAATEAGADVVTGARVTGATRETVAGARPAGGALAVHYERLGVPRGLAADVVVGADGLRSAVREAVAPATSLRYSGHSSWRGVVAAAELVGDRFWLRWGPRAEFGAVRTGPANVYWYGYTAMPEGARLPDERAAALERFAGWASPVRELIERTPPADVMRHDVHALLRPPESYVRDRMVLVGDAAHAMLPTLGQGINLALEDAVTLTSVLAAVRDAAPSGGLDAALASYDASRGERTRSIHRRSEAAARLGAHAGRGVRLLRNAVLPLVPGRLAARGSAGLFAWEPPEAGMAAVEDAGASGASEP